MSNSYNKAYIKHGNLVGMVFGRWTVLSKGNISSSGRMYLCECVCGTQKYVAAASLLRGKSKSCGCLQIEVAKNRPFVNLSGQRFNRLLVIDLAEQGPNGGRRYSCVCDCGNTCVVDAASLKNGHTQSCGCLNKDRVSEAGFVDLTGKQFGRWIVIKRVGKSNAGMITWLCRCSCGVERVVIGQSLLGGRSSSCGCYKIERITKHGKSCTTEYKVMQSRKHREKRKRIDAVWTAQMESILREFFPFCVICGISNDEHIQKYGHALHVDHVLPITNLDGSDGNPLQPGNAIILCAAHNCAKRNYKISSLPIEWQVDIIWAAFKFKTHWDMHYKDYEK